MQTFKTEEEAVELANYMIFGLSGESSRDASLCIWELLQILITDTACVYTSNLSRALRVTRQIETGSVAVND